jgi:hypothetical protein
MGFLMGTAMLKFFLLGCCSVSLCLGENPTLIVPNALLIETRPLIDEDEVKVVDKLIKVTEEQLKKQEQLKELMLFFQKHKEEFVQGNQTKTQASRLVRTARQIQELIKENHLEHLFAKDYLDELQFFSSIAGKTTLSRP